MQETLGLKTILAIIYLVTRLYSAARRWHSRLCRATEWPEVSLDGPAWIKHDPTYAAMSEKVKLQGCLDPVPNILRALSGPRRRNKMVARRIEETGAGLTVGRSNHCRAAKLDY